LPEPVVPLSFQVNLKPEHVRQATAGIYRRQVLKPVVIGGLLGLLAVIEGLFWAVLPQAPWSLRALLAVMAVLSVIGTLYTAGRYYESLAVRNFQRFQGQPAQARLDEEGYHYQASWGSGLVPWAKVDSLWCLPAVWVLLEHADKGVSVLLPVADLDAEAQAYLKARMQARGALVRA
jgi:hypothetical protein